MSEQLTYKILVVEDEYLIRENIVKKINTLSLGFDIIGQASNGQMALDLIKEIAATYPRIKTIIISGFSDFEFAQKAIRYGVQDFLFKPICVEDLSLALQKLQII